MKKLFLFLAVLMTLLIILGSCATNKMENISKDKEIYGTWVNPAYDESRSLKGKIVIMPNGTKAFYETSHDSASNSSWNFVITNKWFDAEGNIWYTTITWNIGAPQERYWITRISEDGKVLELNQSSRDYPESLDPNDIRNPNYAVYSRK